MDLNSIGRTLASNTGTPMHLEAPDGSPLFAYEDDGNRWQVTTDPASVKAETFPCIFSMVGQDSAQFRHRRAEIFRRAQSNKKLKFTEAELEGVRTIAAGIIGWSHIVWNDAPEDSASTPYLFEFNDENLLTMLMGYPPCKDQANAFIGERSNFFTSA